MTCKTDAAGFSSYVACFGLSVAAHVYVTFHHTLLDLVEMESYLGLQRKMRSMQGDLPATAGGETIFSQLPVSIRSPRGAIVHHAPPACSFISRL